tara:strand:+ start:95 stop:418 length:324 start_codon:yes stop_codon:yes gene_type:complete
MSNATTMTEEAATQFEASEKDSYQQAIDREKVLIDARDIAYALASDAEFETRLAKRALDMAKRTYELAVVNEETLINTKENAIEECEEAAFQTRCEFLLACQNVIHS